MRHGGRLEGRGRSKRVISSPTTPSVTGVPRLAAARAGNRAGTERRALGASLFFPPLVPPLLLPRGFPSQIGQPRRAGHSSRGAHDKRRDDDPLGRGGVERGRGEGGREVIIILRLCRACRRSLTISIRWPILVRVRTRSAPRIRTWSAVCHSRLNLRGKG